MPSFDIVSKTDLNEVDNSINMVNRTIQTRFDFKGSNSSIERSDENITLLANDEMQIKQLIQLFEENLSPVITLGRSKLGSFVVNGNILE